MRRTCGSCATRCCRPTWCSCWRPASCMPTPTPVCTTNCLLAPGWVGQWSCTVQLASRQLCVDVQGACGCKCTGCHHPGSALTKPVETSAAPTTCRRQPAAHARRQDCNCRLWPDDRGETEALQSVCSMAVGASQQAAARMAHASFVRTSAPTRPCPLPPHCRSRLTTRLHWWNTLRTCQVRGSERE